LLELFPFFGFPALLIVGGGFMLFVRDTEEHKRTGTRVFGVVLAFIGFVWIAVAGSYFEILGEGMGGSRSRDNDPKTENGRVCKEYLLANFQCNPWLWWESTVPTDPVEGVCTYGSNGAPERFDTRHKVRFVHPCNYRFKCLLKQGEVEAINFSSSANVTGYPKCEKEYQFPNGDFPIKEDSPN